MIVIIFLNLVRFEEQTHVLMQFLALFICFFLSNMREFLNLVYLFIYFISKSLKTNYELSILFSFNMLVSIYNIKHVLFSIMHLL